MFCPHAGLETPVGSIHMETKSGIYVSGLEEQATVWYFCRWFFKKEKFFNFFLTLTHSVKLIERERERHIHGANNKPYNDTGQNVVANFTHET